MASTSKILTDPSTPAGGSTIDGSFSVNFDDDGNITTIVEHVGDSKTVLEPQSQKFKDLQGSNTVMDARNIAKYGSNIESYESLVEEPGNTVPSQTQAQLEEKLLDIPQQKIREARQLAHEKLLEALENRPLIDRKFDDSTKLSKFLKDLLTASISVILLTSPPTAFLPKNKSKSLYCLTFLEISFCDCASLYAELSAIDVPLIFIDYL